LPETFRSGIDEISKHPYCHRYPVFWQWFLWFMGGFILEDHRDEEYQLLSQKCGIPIENIEQAFSSYNLLFPQSGGWLVSQKSSSISIMKLVPLPFMGLGAHLRKLRYSKDKKFNTIPLTGNHTLGDLIKWNNAFVGLLAD